MKIREYILFKGMPSHFIQLVLAEEEFDALMISWLDECLEYHLHMKEQR